MIKIIAHVTKAIIAAVTALLFFSCGFEPKLDGNGNVVTKTRPMSEEFRSVSASDGLEVIIEQGAEKSVTVEADDNLHQHIKTEVSGGELKITADVNIQNAKSKKVIVRVSAIENISASGGSFVKGKMLKTDSMGLSSSSGSNLEVSIEARNVNCESSSGSHMKVSGKTENLETEASSGAHIDAKSLIAQSVRSDASSGSHTYTNPVKNFSGDASSGGHIYYVNTPEQLSKKASSGGEINQE